MRLCVAACDEIKCRFALAGKERSFDGFQFDGSGTEFGFGAARDEWRRGGGADPAGIADWHERVYRFGLSEGGADGAGAAGCGCAPEGREVQGECVYRGVDGPELDGALAMSGAMQMRTPYQSDPITRKLINSGEMQYIDMHLSHVAQLVEYGSWASWTSRSLK